MSNEVAVCETGQHNQHQRTKLYHSSNAHGIEVGGSVLDMKDLRHVLQPMPSTTIFSTSYYSGGWLVRPDINQQQPNTTAGAYNESSSWTNLDDGQRMN
ncbi:unnamed protein product [Penicillium roqueforti FM164]|uniref:Uncharacterized protein n=1 Tax=Penicillium roqueforti (strain FM164) TaxID=1365484 RepID=W6QKJ2_PENRF|nr:unnamed protein product [Penicillium roqueforti FM164]